MSFIELLIKLLQKLFKISLDLNTSSEYIYIGEIAYS